jgi:hypothetical protein
MLGIAVRRMKANKQSEEKEEEDKHEIHNEGSESDEENEESGCGDVVLQDMGQGLSFKPGVFDGAVSISAIQWLCSAETKAHNPYKRIQVFFQSLYNCLVTGGRCVKSIKFQIILGIAILSRKLNPN